MKQNLTQVTSQLARVRDRVQGALLEARREPGDAAILAVSKQQSVTAIETLFRAGQSDFGENFVPMFFGDDQTDEGGFEVVQNASGIAVYIGPPRQPTKALHHLESPKEVAQVLALLVESDP